MLSPRQKCSSFCIEIFKVYFLFPLKFVPRDLTKNKHWFTWLNGALKVKSWMWTYDGRKYHLVRRDTLRRCHNGRDSVSNHQPHDCLLNRLFRRRSNETSKPRVTGLCVGNSPGNGEFPAQMASNAENVSIWWRHHENDTHDCADPFCAIGEILGKLVQSCSWRVMTLHCASRYQPRNIDYVAATFQLQAVYRTYILGRNDQALS